MCKQCIDFCHNILHRFLFRYIYVQTILWNINTQFIGTITRNHYTYYAFIITIPIIYWIMHLLLLQPYFDMSYFFRLIQVHCMPKLLWSSPCMIWCMILPQQLLQANSLFWMLMLLNQGFGTRLIIADMHN